MTPPTHRSTALDSALAGAVERYRTRHPASARQLDQAAEVLPGGNTRSVLFQSPFPLVMAMSARSSTKARAAAPISPQPWGPGREVGWSRIPQSRARGIPEMLARREGSGNDRLSSRRLLR